jgi:hypothetical protein
LLADTHGPGGIVGRFGYERDLWDVLTACRVALEPPGDDGLGFMADQLDLLRALAHPFVEWQKAQNHGCASPARHFGVWAEMMCRPKQEVTFSKSASGRLSVLSVCAVSRVAGTDLRH